MNKVGNTSVRPSISSWYSQAFLTIVHILVVIYHWCHHICRDVIRTIGLIDFSVVSYSVEALFLTSLLSLVW